MSKKVSEALRGAVGSYPFTDEELNNPTFPKRCDLDRDEYAALRDALPLAEAMEEVVRATGALMRRDDFWRPDVALPAEYDSVIEALNHYQSLLGDSEVKR